MDTRLHRSRDASTTAFLNIGVARSICPVVTRWSLHDYSYGYGYGYGYGYSYGYGYGYGYNSCCPTLFSTRSHRPHPPIPVRRRLRLSYAGVSCCTTAHHPTAYHWLTKDAYGSCCNAGLLTADTSASGGFAASLPPAPPQTVLCICLPPLLVDC